MYDPNQDYDYYIGRLEKYSQNRKLIYNNPNVKRLIGVCRDLFEELNRLKSTLPPTPTYWWRCKLRGEWLEWKEIDPPNFRKKVYGWGGYMSIDEVEEVKVEWT